MKNKLSCLPTQRDLSLLQVTFSNEIQISLVRYIPRLTSDLTFMENASPTKKIKRKNNKITVTRYPGQNAS